MHAPSNDRDYINDTTASRKMRMIALTAAAIGTGATALVAQALVSPAAQSAHGVRAISALSRGAPRSIAAFRRLNTSNAQPAGGAGSVGAYGDAEHHGAIGGYSVAPLVGMAATPSGNGYWLAAANGGVFAFGDAPFLGSMAANLTSHPIVGMATTNTGRGYWLVADDGGVFAFGDAAFHGSAAALSFTKPIVGMANTATGDGYWLVAADGGVFAFGDAAFVGSSGQLPLRQPVVSIAATPTGHGYWLVARDGGVFSFGDALFHGGLTGQQLNAPVVAMTSTPSGDGYWIATADGGVFAFGDAPFKGSMAPSHVPAPVVGLQATPDGDGYWMVTGSPAPVASSALAMDPIGTFGLSCYTLAGTTASGLPVSDQVIATDPRVIPLGTHVFIPGLGQLAPRLAADTGGAIKGNRIDVWMASNSECAQFGRQSMEVFRIR